MKRDRPQEVEMAVLALLKKGNDNATTGGELATITGYNTRLISSAISNLIIHYDRNTIVNNQVTNCTGY